MIYTSFLCAGDWVVNSSVMFNRLREGQGGGKIGREGKITVPAKN